MSALRSRLYETEMKKKLRNIQEQHDKKGEAGWGNQIRSYVLHPYKLIKDLRSGYETSKVNEVLDGKINNFLVWFKI